jgi:DNA polymerase IV
MRLLCILLPHFPLRCEILGRPELEGCPAVVTYAAGAQRLILDFAAELKGLYRDMPLQQALSAQEDIEVIHADLPRYWSIFNSILDDLELKSPLVEGSSLGEVYLGLDGLQSIYPTEDILVHVVREVLPAVFDARLGIAVGKFSAYLAAQYSPPQGYKALAGDLSLFLEGLPCDLLPVAPKTKSRLHDFGLHTLGQVTRLSAAQLQAQFGPEGKRVRELASGDDNTPLCPRLTEETIEESTILPSATVSLDLMLTALEAMLTRAFIRLAPRGMGICSISLWTRTWVGEHCEQTIRFKEPAMNVKAALSRIKQVMDSFPQPGPVEQLGLKITGMAHRWGKQKSLFPEVRTQDHLLNDIKQLEFRLGSPQLYRIKEVEPWSRTPERRYVLAPLSQ